MAKAKYQKGFTLVELLVVVAVFSILSVTLFGFLASSMQAQRRALAQQYIIDQLNYSMDIIGRQIRMAKIRKTDDSLLTDCLGYALPVDQTFSQSASGAPNQSGTSALAFPRITNFYDPSGVSLEIGHAKGCELFYLNGDKRIHMYVRPDPADTSTGYKVPFDLPITSNDVEITDFKITISGDGYSNNDQPKVTVFIKGRGKGTVFAAASVTVQSTFSKRDLDVVPP